MKTFALISVLTIAAWSVYGCASQQRSDETVQTYQCPNCQDTVKWKYHPTKSWIKTGKEVVHSCSSCEKTWGSNLSIESTCNECGKEHLECPMCRKHG